MKLEYVYYDEWKELKKQKRYEEAAFKLGDEIIYNLARVHNAYSDLKIEAEYGNTDIVMKFSMNSQGEFIDELEDFYNVMTSIAGSSAMFDEQKLKEREKYNAQKRLKRCEQIQKELVKLFKKRINKYE